jgi:hypothetical protein
MNALAEQRCLQHPQREAAARCPECHQSYCRECILEYEERILCARCVARIKKQGKIVSGWKHGALLLLQAVFAFGLLWLCFYSLGRTLLAVPSAFHEGELWKRPTE